MKLHTINLLLDLVNSYTYKLLLLITLRCGHFGVKIKNGQNKKHNQKILEVLFVVFFVSVKFRV